MRAHCSRRRLLRVAKALSQCGFLYRLDLPVDGLSCDHVPGAVCNSAHQWLDGAVGRRLARSRAEDCAPAPGVLGLRLAALRAARYERLGPSIAGFSLWGLVLARTKFHRLKPALPTPHSKICFL